MIDCVVVKVLFWNNGLDNFLLEFSDLIGKFDVLRVLCRDDNGVDSKWHNFTVSKGMINSDLSLGVWSEPGAVSVSSQFCHLLIESMSQNDSKGHALLSFIGRVAEHKTLIKTKVTPI